METVSIFLVLLIGVIIYLSFRLLSLTKRRDETNVLHQRLDSLNQTVVENLHNVTNVTVKQLNDLTNQVNQRLKDNTDQMNQRLQQSMKLMERSHKSIGERLDNASNVVNTVTNKLSQLEEANKRIFEVGKDIAQLQEILRAPKLRGGLGELFLEDLLGQIFSKQYYSLQYTFSTGVKVDAVIKLRDNLLVPVDAKFPLENFKKMLGSQNDASREKSRREFICDVKKHIVDISSKYIVPDEGTFDFALMYIPAENVYYELIAKTNEDEDFISFAFQKRVIPVSPNTFYVYLQSILLGLRGFQIEKEAKNILMLLGRLRSDFENFHATFEVLGKHLRSAQKNYDVSEKNLNLFGTTLLNAGNERFEEIEPPKNIHTAQE